MSTSQGIRVFVYGSLKKGHGNHGFLTDPTTTFLGRHIMEGPYQMVSLGAFPAVLYLANSKVKNKIFGEVYRISEDTLKELDALEGNGSFYTRNQVVTPWKKAWCYFGPASYLADPRRWPLVENGTWRPNSEEQKFVAESTAIIKG